MIAYTFDAAQLVRSLASLVALLQWVCWRVEVRTNAKGEQKPTKVPVNPVTGANADSQRPETWGSFEQAVKRARREGIGIGFVFRSGGNVFGLDMDKCLDPATGAVEPWAAGHVALLHSYTDITPSGTGFHVLGLATPPASGRRTGRLELYGSARFFTMTGNVLPGTGPLRECQPELDTLFRDVFGAEDKQRAARVADWHPVSAAPSDLREKAAQGRIRRATLALLDSTGGDTYPSASEADAALAAALIGAGLTESEALELFRSSTRGRGAYDRKGSEHHADYYLRRTIENAATFVGPVIERPGGMRLRLAGQSGFPFRLQPQEVV